MRGRDQSRTNCTPTAVAPRHLTLLLRRARAPRDSTSTSESGTLEGSSTISLAPPSEISAMVHWQIIGPPSAATIAAARLSCLRAPARFCTQSDPRDGARELYQVTLIPRF